jgi:PAS domain S-box-containing protein
VAAYAGVLAVAALLVWAALAGWIPVFFVQGQGGTLIRQVVLVSAIAMFVLAAGLMLSRHRRQPSAFLYWYGLGLALLAVGMTGVLLQSAHGSPLGWTGRISQYVGGVYLFVAAVAGARGTGTWRFSLVPLDEGGRPNKLLAEFRHQTSLGRALRYGLAVVAVTAAMGFRQAVTAWAGPGLPTYITFYPAVMAVALLGGLGPGLLATAMAGLVVAYWVLPPIGQFTIAGPVDRLGLVIFTGMGLFMSVVAELSRSYRLKAAAYDREAALRESQARLATFAAATFEGIVESDAGRIVDCNEQLDKMLGYTLAELKGMEIASLIAPEDRDRVLASILQGQTSVTEHAMLRKDGTRIIVEAHGRPVSPGSATRLTVIRDITERKRAGEELRKSEERLTFALETSHTGAWELDLGNHSARRSLEHDHIFGYPALLPEWTYEMFLEHVLPEDRPVVDGKFRRAVETGGDWSFACRIRRADQQVRWIWAAGKHRTDAAGVRRSMAGIVQDVTERKQAEEAVHRLNAELQRRVAELQAANEVALEARREAERINADLQKTSESLGASRRAALNLMDDAVLARQQAEQAGAESHSAAEQRRLALEAADLGAWDYHFQTGEVFWDERCREMWGLPQGEKIDYPGAIAAIHPEDRGAVDEAVSQALAGKSGGVYNREFRVVWPDGSVHWIASHGRVYFEGEGGQRRAVRFIGANLEVTAEKQAAEAVRQSEERYRALVELSPEGVFVNRDNRIVLVNSAALELFGASRGEQLLGKSPFEVFHRDCHAMMRERIGKILAGQRAPALEEKIVRLDGVVVDVEVVASPVTDQGERAILVLLRDITERKQAEAALRQTTDDLQRSNRDLEQFAYIASHDLQEPLRAVGGYVKLLEHRFPDKLDAKARDYIAGAFDGAIRMERLITDLLAFSRVGTRGGAFAAANLDVALEHALGNLAVGIKSANAIITRDALPTLSVDSTQIMQLFQNLIGNALKFHGEQPPRIHVGARRQDERWVISVRDNGIGMEPQYFERIFQVFQRLHTRKQYPGTGIGLAICKRIVERHSGTIWVESQPGLGSTFFFSLPES